MTGSLKSILGGITCASLLIVPLAAMAASNAPSPPAMPDTSGVPASPAWHGGQWGHLPLRTYVARSLKVDDLVGALIVTVEDSGPMTVEAWGPPPRLNGLDVAVHDGRLEVDASGYEDTHSVWDWHHWFDFSEVAESSPHDLTVRIGVPRGSDIDIESLVGHATIGDTQGSLRLAAASTQASIGHVASANVELGGSGRVDIAAVTGALKLEVGGSGKIATGPIGSLQADIAGSGDARFGPIAGGLDLNIAGAGDVSAPRVNGPTKISIAGSGSVKIADGTADPLHVEIMGAGKLDFGGIAVDPHVEAFGSGSVRIKSYRGRLSSEGMADVRIGD